ncbi:hypothetical protein BJ170DRAFT_679705 [Xylariales sp. AK1849]|nr:hypothetical protein BJ170DRAFT_679705 [Xylariales sp. AK1849]
MFVQIASPSPSPSPLPSPTFGNVCRTPPLCDLSFADTPPSWATPLSAPSPSLTFGDVCRTPPLCDLSFADTPPPWDHTPSSIHTAPSTHLSIDSAPPASPSHISSVSVSSDTSALYSRHFSWIKIQDPLWGPDRVQMVVQHEEDRKQQLEFMRLHGIEVCNSTLSESVSGSSIHSFSEFSWTTVQEPTGISRNFLHQHDQWQTEARILSWERSLAVFRSEISSIRHRELASAIPSIPSEDDSSSTLSSSDISSVDPDPSWVKVDDPLWTPFWVKHLCPVIERRWEEAREAARLLAAAPDASSPNTAATRQTAGPSTSTPSPESSGLHSLASEVHHTHSHVEVIHDLPASDNAVTAQESSIHSETSVSSTRSESVAGSYHSCPDAYIHSDHSKAPDMANIVREHVRRVSFRDVPHSLSSPATSALSDAGRPRVASWFSKACTAVAVGTAVVAGLAYAWYSS